ncbi:tail fiber domain-containing protein [Acutalibacter sp. 1XD8-36]|uniref:tail fiber domain-containing protein n=1 Tax=Acutalibacter sp. 1XD8-36 TaxID=2320852 RepID=UPI002615BBD0|nr:tail fiber domain-containing protein [Acutalibacter sp. 1XD8-36]
MRERSAIWQKIAARGDFGEDVEAVIAGKTYTAISAPVIERALCDSAVSVGNCIAASLKLSLLTEDIIPPASEVVIRARLYRGEAVSEWKEFGTFYIDRREENEGLVTLQCFDAMLKASQQYADPTDPEDRIGWPKTMADCVEEVAYRIGVELDPRTAINTGAAYQVPYPDRLSMQEVLGHIGACHGGNWVITPENKLRLITLVSPPAETFNIIDYEYNRIYTGGGYKLVWKHTGTGETVEHPAGGGLVQVPVVTGSIATGTKVNVTRTTIGADDDLGYTKGDSTGGELRIEDNPYACQAICDNLYEKYNGLEYAPYVIAGACFDPCAELGDWVLAGDKVRSVLYKCTLTFGADFRADIEAPYQEEVSSEYPYLSAIRQLKQKDKLLEKYMEAQKDEIHSEISQTRTQILLQVGGTYATKEQVNSALQVTTEGIMAEVEKKLPDGTEMEELKSSVKQTSEAITAEVTRAKGQEQALSSKIEQTAKSITLSVENGEQSSTIKLTGDGIEAQSKTIRFTGKMLFASNLTDGETEISGGNIKTGKIVSKNGLVYFDLDNNEIACSKLVGAEPYGNIPQAVMKVNTGFSSSGTYYGRVKLFVEGSEDNGLILSPSSDSHAEIKSQNGLEIGNGLSNGIISITDMAVKVRDPHSVNTYFQVGESRLTLNGAIYAALTRITTTSDFSYSLGINSEGKIVKDSSSSRRYKHDIAPVTDKRLDPRRLYELPVVQYVFNDGYLSPGDLRRNKAVIGLIAEDVAEHYPIAATYDGEGGVENWQERYIVPALLALVQEQHHEIEALRERISRLEDAYGRQADK